MNISLYFGMRRVVLAPFRLAALLGLLVLGGRGEARAQDGPGVRMGGHFSINPAQFEVREERLGIHAIMPVLDVVELSPAVSYYAGNDFPDPAWQITASVRVRPFGPGTGSPPYIGAGGAMLHHARGTFFHDLLLAGAEFPVGQISLFAEGIFYDFFRGGPFDGGALNAVLGFNVPLR